MKNYLLTALAVCALLSSCKKKDNQATCESTIAALAGKYKLTSVKFAGQEMIDSHLLACEKDDYYFLKADKTVEYTDAGFACDEPAVNGAGTWDIVNGNLTIDMKSGNGDDVMGKVTNKCNGFELVESFLDVPVSGSDIKFTFTKM